MSERKPAVIRSVKGTSGAFCGRPESIRFTALLGILAGLPALSIDISAPTLAQVSTSLQTSTTVAGLTLSLFMAGFAFGQLGGGAVSDRHGRRPVLLAGLLCYTLAGIGCILSPSGGALVACRFIQGVGAGACSVLSFAMVQDLFVGQAARSKRSYVTVVFGVVPIFAPALGSVVSDLAGWRAVHGVLAAAGAMLLAVTWQGVRESINANPDHAREPGRRVALPFRRDPKFIAYAAANALSYACIFAYITGSPLVMLDQLRLSSAVFAALFASTGAALTAGAWASGRLGRSGVGASALLDPSLIVTAGAAAALGLASLAGVTSGALLIPLLMIVLFARGIIAPNLQQLAIEQLPEQAGAASAAVGVSQLAVAALTSAAVAGLFPRLGETAVAIPMALLAAAALAAWRLSQTKAYSAQRQAPSRRRGTGAP